MIDFDALSDGQLWDALGEAEHEERVEVLMELCHRAGKEGEYARAGDLASQAATEAERLMSASKVEECRFWEGRSRYQCGDYEEAHSAHAAGIAAYVALDETFWLARNHYGLAEVAYAQADHDAAAEAARASAEAALAADDRQYAAGSLLLCSRALYYGNNDEAGLETCREARALFRSVPVPFGVAEADDFAATILLYLDRADEAAEVLETLLMSLKTIGSGPDVAYATRRLAYARFQQRKDESALELFGEALALYQEDQDRIADIATCQALMGRCYERLGLDDEAITCARSASALWDSVGDDLEYLRTQGTLSRLLFSENMVGEAIRVNQRIVDAARDSSEETIQFEGAWARLRLADDFRELGEWEHAIEILDADTYWQERPGSGGQLWMASLRARSLYALGMVEEALGVADSALAATEDDDVNLSTALLYEIKARVELAQGRPDRERHLAHAIALLLAFGQVESATELAAHFKPSFDHAHPDGPDGAERLGEASGALAGTPGFYL